MVSAEAAGTVLAAGKITWVERMRHKLTSMIPAAALALGMAVAGGAAVPALAQPGHGPECGPGAPPMLGGIDLTKKQKTAIHKVFEDDHAASKDLRKQSRALHEQEMELLMTPGKIDTAQLQSVTQQEEALNAKEHEARLNVAVKIHDILTTDQLTQLKDRHDKVKALREQIRAVEHPNGDDTPDAP